MAVDKKISQLTSLAQGDVDAALDVLPIVDTSANETKKITVTALVSAGATAGISGAVLTNGTINSTTIGATTPSTGAFTTLTTSSTVTLNGGTANGVLYLNGSKVATSGTGLAYDGTNFSLGAAWTNNPMRPTTAPLYFQYASTGNNILAVMGDNVVSSVQVNRFSDNTTAPNINMGKARGTYASPTAVQTGDFLGNLQFRGYGGTTSRILASIDGLVETYTSDTNIASALYFATSSSGVASATEKMRLDSAGNLGIGTTSPAAKLEVATSGTGTEAETVRLSMNTGAIPASAGLNFRFGSVNGATIYGVGENGSTGASSMRFYTHNGTSSAERMRLDSSGNVGIGTPSPGVKLDVVGDIRSTTGNFYAVNGGAFGWGDLSTYVGGNASTDFINFVTAGSERARIDSSGNVGIGGTAAAFTKVDLVGTLSSSSNFSEGYRVAATIPSGTTNVASMFVTYPTTQAASFTLGTLAHFRAIQNTLGAGSAITTQYGFLAEASLTGATNNYGFYSNIASGSNRWNFYAAGTADNYFAGNVGIADTGLTNVRLRVKGSGTGAADYTIYCENSAATPLLYVQNDGKLSTGTAANSPYNLTTASAANVFVDSSGFLYRSTSSLRYKTNVANATHGLADVLKLRSVIYKGKNDSDTVFGGLIAEEVHDAGLTEFVAYDKEGRPDALHYGNMVALLVKAVQELSAKVTALEAR